MTKQMGGDEEAESVGRILNAKTLYEVLDVQTTCTAEEIKKGYRKLALKVHPDHNQHPKATEAFQRVSHAYQLLSNPEKRSRYDRDGEQHPENLGSRQPQAQRFYTNGNSGFYTFDDEFSPEDLFRMFYGMRPGYPARRRRQQAQEEPRLKWQLLFYVIPILLLSLMSMWQTSSADEWSSVFHFEEDLDQRQFHILTSYKMRKQFGVPREWMQRQHWLGRVNQRFYQMLREKADDVYAEKLRGECRHEVSNRMRSKPACDELRSHKML
jgi:DnaJ family protein B protein 12